MSEETTLSGTFRVPIAGSLRLTLDPYGTPQHAVVPLGEGAIYPSHELFLSVLKVQLSSQISGSWDVSVVPFGIAQGAVRITTPGGLPYSVEWSYLGDCNAVRDWLGQYDDLAGIASGAAWAHPLRAYLAPTIAAQRVQLSSVSRPRAHKLLLSGYQTQQNGDISNLDERRLSVELWIGDPSDLAAELAAFEQFWSDLRLCDQECATLRHGLEAWRVMLDGETTRLTLNRVTSDNRLWSCNLELRVVHA